MRDRIREAGAFSASRPGPRRSRGRADARAAYPHGARVRRSPPAAADPDPASLPGPITRNPHITRPRRFDNDLRLRRGRGFINDYFARRWTLNIDGTLHAAGHQRSTGDSTNATC